MKVIGYIRVSTNQQDLTRQKQLIEKWCNTNGYTLKRIIGEKMSGARSDREGLQELLTIKSSEADVIAVSELSRISRQDDIMNVIAQLNNIRNNGVSLYILDTNTWIKADEDIDGLGVMKIVFTAMGNADERKKITNRMTTGRYTKLLENPYAFIGGQVPYGFTVIDNPNYELHKTAKTILKVDEKQANYIRIMYSKIINEGYTLPMLARYCIDNRIKFAKDSTSKENYVALLYGIITNPIYKGERMYKGEIFRIEPIVDAEVWNRVKVSLADNKLFSSTAKRYDLYNPLKGLLKCACGHNLYVTECKNYYYFKCAHKKTLEGERVCNNNGLKLDIAIKAVWENSKYLTLKEDWDLQTSKQEAAVKQDIEVITSAYAALRNEYAKYENEKVKIVKKIEMMESEELIGIFSKKYEQLDKKRKEVFKEILSKEEELKRLEKKLKQLENTTKEMKLDALNDETKSAILHNIIDKATWYSDKLRSGFLVIDYKNGLQIVSMICTTKKHNFIYQLPSGFIWDNEKRQVKTMVFKKVKDAEGIFPYESTYEYYTFDRLKKECVTDEWIIEENIEHTTVTKKR